MKLTCVHQGNKVNESPRRVMRYGDRRHREQSPFRDALTAVQLWRESLVSADECQTKYGLASAVSCTFSWAESTTITQSHALSQGWFGVWAMENRESGASGVTEAADG